MHLQAVIKDSYEDFKRNYLLAAPTLVASFISVFITFMIWRRPSDSSTSTFVGILSSFVILYAHGATLAMARELLENGSTSISTAIDISKNAFVSLMSLSLALTALVMTGMRLFVAPGLTAVFFLIYALPLAVSEGAGPFDAIKRSFHMAVTHKHDTLVLVSALVLSGLALALISAMLSIVPLLGQLASVLLAGAYGGVVALVIMRVYAELLKK